MDTSSFNIKFNNWDSIKYNYYIIEYHITHSWWSVVIIALFLSFAVFYFYNKKAQKRNTTSSTIRKHQPEETSSKEVEFPDQTIIEPVDMIDSSAVIESPSGEEVLNSINSADNTIEDTEDNIPGEDIIATSISNEIILNETTEALPKEEITTEESTTLREEENKNQSEEEEITDTSSTPEYSQELVEKFKQYIITNKGYLDPEIKVEKIVSVLYSNRTTISVLVNKEFHCAFRDLINGMRIEYSKQYMIEHLDATQEEVATASGFSCASVFNRKFKQIEQMAPREWLKKHKDGII